MPRRRVSRRQQSAHSASTVSNAPLATSSPLNSRLDNLLINRGEREEHLNGLLRRIEQSYENVRKETIMEIERELRILTRRFKFQMGRLALQTVFEVFEFSPPKEKAKPQRLHRSRRSRTISPCRIANKKEVSFLDQKSMPTTRPRPSSVDRYHNSRMKTPKSTRVYRNVATVTPGPGLKGPHQVLRWPRAGELAISIEGSPLHVPTVERCTEMPQITLPIEDSVYSIFPQGQSLPLEERPILRDETRKQLQVLKRYLEELCKPETSM